MKTLLERINREEPLPEQWGVKDVEAITGLAVVDVDTEISTRYICCTLANGVRFWIPKW